MDEESERLYQDFLSTVTFLTTSDLEEDIDDPIQDPDYDLFKDLQTVEFTDEELNFDDFRDFFNDPQLAGLQENETPASPSASNSEDSTSKEATSTAETEANKDEHFTVEQGLILQSQLAFHLQTLTQTYLLSAVLPEHQSINETSKNMLQELAKFTEPNETALKRPINNEPSSGDSGQTVVNLAFENVPASSALTFLDKRGPQIEKAERRSSLLIVSEFFRRSILSRRDIFKYEWAFPDLRFTVEPLTKSPSDDGEGDEDEETETSVKHQKTNKRGFWSLAEDWLIALAMDEQKRSQQSKKVFRQLYELIRELKYLPSKSLSCIRFHVKYLKKQLSKVTEKETESPENPVTHFLLHGRLPPVFGFDNPEKDIYRNFRRTPRWFKKREKSLEEKDELQIVLEPPLTEEVDNLPTTKESNQKTSAIKKNLKPIMPHRPIAPLIEYQIVETPSYATLTYQPAITVIVPSFDLLQHQQQLYQTTFEQQEGESWKVEKKKVKRNKPLGSVSKKKSKKTVDSCTQTKNLRFDNRVQVVVFEKDNLNLNQNKKIVETEKENTSDHSRIDHDEETSSLPESPQSPPESQDKATSPSSPFLPSSPPEQLSPEGEEGEDDIIEEDVDHESDDFIIEEEEYVDGMEIMEEEEEVVEEDDDQLLPNYDEHDLNALMMASCTAVSNRAQSRHHSSASSTSVSSSTLSSTTSTTTLSPSNLPPAKITKSRAIALERASTLFILKAAEERHCRKEEWSPEEEARREHFVAYYLKRAQEVLGGGETYVAFLQALISFQQSQNQGQQGQGLNRKRKHENSSEGARNLYKGIQGFLGSLKKSWESEKPETPKEAGENKRGSVQELDELAELLVLFLSHSQAAEAGVSFRHLHWRRMMSFTRNVELYFRFIYANKTRTQRGAFQRLIKSLKQIEAQMKVSSEGVSENKAETMKLKIKAAVARCLNGHTALLSEFSALFLDEPPPPCLYAGAEDFEEFCLDEEDDRKFERVVVPLGKTDQLYGTSECHCKCHRHVFQKNSSTTTTITSSSTTSTSSSSSSTTITTVDHQQTSTSTKCPRSVKNHCASCSLRFISGRLYVPQYNSSARKVQLVEHVTLQEKELSSKGKEVEGFEVVEEEEINLVDGREKVVNSKETPGNRKWTMEEDRLLLEACQQSIVEWQVTELNGHLFTAVAKKVSQKFNSGVGESGPSVPELADRLQFLVEMVTSSSSASSLAS